MEEKCMHVWKMVNISCDCIITEKCYHCNKLSTYPASEQIPPQEEYREGDHFWVMIENAQFLHFDLKCTQCNKLVKLEELLGLMMCSGCNEKCEVDILRKKLETERIWVYVAFGYFPIEDKKQLTQEQLLAVEEYFNQQRKASKSRIKVVSSQLVGDITNCFAEVIKDVGKHSFVLPEEK